jgi:hypothetical protein
MKCLKELIHYLTILLKNNMKHPMLAGSATTTFIFCMLVLFGAYNPYMAVGSALVTSIIAIYISYQKEE